MAIVAEGSRGRVYLAPTPEHEVIARQASPDWMPEVEMNQDSKDLLSGRGYGFKWWHELFTQRQLVALTTFSDLVQEARERVKADALAAGMVDDGKGLEAGGSGATAYAEAVSVYLAFGVSRASDAWGSLVTWRNQVESSRNTFARQALPMTWDYTEVSPFSNSCGNWTGNSTDWVVESLENLPIGVVAGKTQQATAQTQRLSELRFVATDPPYYDNIGYADLSDYFYIWLRRCLGQLIPELFTTIAVPKAEELVAAPYRHGGKQQAEAFFLRGMTEVLSSVAKMAHPAAPIPIFYAFKQSESAEAEGTSSTGWITFLEAVLRSGFSITGTWPMRTEKEGRVIGNGTNALASSIVLVCRRRPNDAKTISRREFLRELNTILPEALEQMTKGAGEDRSPVAPVDLSQAIIGPGMAVFSKYAAVLEADGTPMSVKTALQLINRYLAESDFDADTQFCLHWFEQHAWNSGPYGEADVLARAKGTAVDGVVQAGVVESKKGKVRLLKPAEYSEDWNPAEDDRLPVWEALHQLVARFSKGGEGAAAPVLGQLLDKAEAIRQLAYRLYTLCERQGLAEDARGYNELVASWSAIEQSAPAAAPAPDSQLKMFT